MTNKPSAKNKIMCQSVSNKIILSQCFKTAPNIMLKPTLYSLSTIMAVYNIIQIRHSHKNYNISSCSKQDKNQDILKD